MKTVKCWKVVSVADDGRLLSAFAHILPADCCVEYVVGEPVRAHTGKLFAFTDFSRAVRFLSRRSLSQTLAPPQLYKAVATNPTPVNTVLALNACQEDFDEFWSAGTDLYDLGLPFIYAIEHTIVADTIALIKRIDVPEAA